MGRITRAFACMVIAAAVLASGGCGAMGLREVIKEIVAKGTIPAPSGLGAAALSISSIGLAWTDNSNYETGFKVERSLSATSGFALVATAAADATSWDDTGLAAGTTYYYRVCATNAMGDSAYTAVASVTISAQALLPITVVTIASAGDSFQMGDATYGPNPPTGITQTISYGYNLSKYEITNAQFAQFMFDNGYTTSSYWTTNGWNYKVAQNWTQPKFWADANYNGANQPVVGVSWYEAVAFCNWRSAKEGLTKAYNDAGQATLAASGYRLPTEVEWEYAAAKGASGQTERLYPYGSTWYSSKVVCRVNPANASKPEDVGSKSPAGGDTPQGLCDMSGNVSEWCSDNYQADASVTAGTDRYYFADDWTSQYFLVRGGTWNDAAYDSFNCACRNVDHPGNRADFIGFRVCRP